MALLSPTVVCSTCDTGMPWSPFPAWGWGLYNRIQTWCSCPLNDAFSCVSRAVCTPCEILGSVTCSVCQQELSDDLTRAKDYLGCVTLCDYPKGKTQSHLKRQPVPFQYNKGSPGNLLFLKLPYNVCFVLCYHFHHFLAETQVAWLG